MARRQRVNCPVCRSFLHYRHDKRILWECLTCGVRGGMEIEDRQSGKLLHSGCGGYLKRVD